MMESVEFNNGAALGYAMYVPEVSELHLAITNFESVTLFTKRQRHMTVGAMHSNAFRSV